ncbi:iron transporter FeoB [Azospirillum sp. TSH100]|uniref:ferrous iron transport protein B n=1 Tax=Azospirillum sp. TSH100 TaxID=652764 RepID=UPI000D605ADD|nr:ferrous iron transport protein B [Azospirillum sp. TSH100]PWC90902.1 iron transporter FeoB [Azospirillum sp. TSH100]QCG90733.1 ferrous iron transport protein B [Azospirillum sp. TSH100]
MTDTVLSTSAFMGVPPRIALVGNPNCGKTALFNALTGARQKVANYPGVTVERKVGEFLSPAGTRVQIVDLPGTYSLRARSPDEEVTRDVVLGRFQHEAPPDVMVCVADATNLRLHLRLVLELKKLGRPIILALNMMDVAEARGCRVDAAALSAALGVPVVPTVAIRRTGVVGLLDQIDRSMVAMTAGLVPAPCGSSPCGWSEPSANDLRAYHQEVESILAAALRDVGKPSIATRRIDAALLHPAIGLPFLFLVLFLMFQAVFAWAAVPMDMIDRGLGWVQAATGAALPDGMLKSLLTDGIIAGVGSVVIFLPQILVLFFFILMLESTGYMARAAFLLDRLMGGVGLHGRAFIPLLSSFACAVPGIMAARTIENRADRLATIMIAPLMTCSARLPVYTLIIAAFVPNRSMAGGMIGLQGLVMFTLYAAGILSALAVAFVLKRTIFKGAREPLLMELPSYRLPSPRDILLGLLERTRIFLARAGTVIFAIMILLWFLGSFPAAPDGATGPAIDYSFAGMLGHALAPLLAPVGFTWQIAIALVPGMAAREVAVAALGTVYALSETGDALSGSLASVLAADWSLPTALSLLAWFVFAPQCVSTLSVVKRETNSWFWMLVMIAYMTALAYGAAFITFRLSSALLGG